MIKVSIIIPVYNVEQYLRECLDSVINQTLKEIEIICVDDCSPDSSYKILEEYSQKDSRIKLIKHEINKGLGPARNTGIHAANGEYIGFIDSDDYIALDFFEQLYTTAKKYDSDITSTLNIITYANDADKEKKNQFISMEGKSNINIRKEEYMISTAWSKIYRKKFIIENELFFMDIKSGPEDEDLYQRMLLLDQKSSYNNKAIYYYRKRHASITATIAKNLNNQIDTISLMLNSINFAKKIQSKDIDYLYIRTFSIVLDRLNITNYKEEFYKYLYDFTMQINLKKGLASEILYGEYCIIKSNKEYKNYIKEKKRTLGLINKIVWWIPIKKYRDKIRNKIIRVIYYDK